MVQTPKLLGGKWMADLYPIDHLVDELGKFIHQWSWDLFVTLTYRAKFLISPHYARSQWKRLISAINKTQGTDAYWVRSLETGREQTMPHIHALIGGAALSPREIPRLWHPRTGNAAAEVYDPARRAAWYIAKNPDSVEFSPNLAPPPIDNIGR